MRLRLAVPSGLGRDDTAAVLDAALESLTRASAPMIQRGIVPTFARALKAGRVRWRPEPPGDEHFDLPQTVLKRGWGDCDDLAPWHAASLRASGRDPEAAAIVRPSGPGRWHAVVERGDGSIEDPSKAAGMGVVGGDEYVGPFWRPMFPERMSMATYPLVVGWAARVDCPDEEDDLTWSSVATSRGPKRATRAAIQGMMPLAENLYDEDLVRLAGIHDLLCGASHEDVDEALEHEGAIGFLPGLLPAAGALSSLIPGGGGKEGKAPAGGGGGGGGYPSGATMAMPGGPIIVRF